MDDLSPTLLLLAGVNGTGKSTFIKRYLDQNNLEYKYINPDETGKREALKLCHEYINNNISFIRETTLSGLSIGVLINKAKEKSYKITLIYLLVDKVEESINRVKERVNKGGHNILEKDIIRRYKSYKKVLLEKSKLVDEGIIINNSLTNPRIIATINKGKIILIENILNYDWLKTV